MDLKTKIDKTDQLLATIAQHDDEEHSAVIVALEHIKSLADQHIAQTNERRGAAAAALKAQLQQ
jgi:hypothetical protein